MVPFAYDKNFLKHMFLSIESNFVLMKGKVFDSLEKVWTSLRGFEFLKNFLWSTNLIPRAMPERRRRKHWLWGN
jgi:hypothetical protein